MRHFVFAVGFGLIATGASADLLSRYEAAETAIRIRQAEMMGSAPNLWTDADRTGKACLLSELSASAGAAKAEGYVAYLEGVAAQRMSYANNVDLTSDWMRATTASQIWFEDMVPISQACGVGF